MKTKTPTWDKADWTPVRRGSIYCSPTCGGGCTHRAYLAAVKKSEALAKKMGTGWKASVWENLGWHWSVESLTGVLEINLSGDGKFSAFFNEGSFWSRGNDTPMKAVQSVLKQVKDKVESLTSKLEQAERSITKRRTK